MSARGRDSTLHADVQHAASRAAAESERERAARVRTGWRTTRMLPVTGQQACVDAGPQQFSERHRRRQARPGHVVGRAKLRELVCVASETLFVALHGAAIDDHAPAAWTF